MTNVLIRRLMGIGFTPSNAYEICRKYQKEFSLSDLEIIISRMEASKADVDKIQPKSDRTKCWGLLRESDRQST